MRKNSLSLLKAGMTVTFNWGKDPNGNPILRTGEFRKMSKEHPNQAVVKWQKDDEDSPSRHWVHFGALHTPEIDRIEREQDEAEAKRKVDEKAAKEIAKSQKQEAEKAKKQKEAKKVASSKNETAKAILALADAIKKCNDLGLDLSKFGL